MLSKPRAILHDSIDDGRRVVRHIKSPLAGLRSLKLKMSIVILVAIAITAALSQIGFRLGWPIQVRPVIAAVLALVMVRWLAFGQLRPLKQMEHAANQMARGQHGHRVDVTTADEIGRLAASFNVMAAELEATDQLRRDLIATAAHELRTPIAGLQATLENGIDGVTTIDERSLTMMHTQVTRLGRLVNDMLDLSRLEAGVAPLRREEVKVAELIESAVSTLTFRTAPVIHLPEPDLVVHVDADRLVQLLVNLLDNASQHGGDVIELTALHTDGRFVLTIDDNGDGFTPGDEQRVFERFHRSSSAIGTGTGLGLAIVRWIVELHDGSVRAEQRQPNGARIVVDLPASAS
jgi:signal transduction histidine kinase